MTSDFNQFLADTLSHLGSLVIDRDDLVPDGPKTLVTTGGFATVERMKYKPDGRTVAMKKLNSEGIELQLLKRRTVREVLVWSKLRHAHIIEFIGFHLEEKPPQACLVCPWEDLGTLSSYVKNLSPARRLPFIRDVCDGLSYMHSLQQPIYHGDIKGSNVLVRIRSGKPAALLCDFGAAGIMNDADFKKFDVEEEFQGSYRWCSPELFGSGTRTLGSDVWSWGWLVWEIITGHLPFFAVRLDLAVIGQIVLLKFEAYRRHLTSISKSLGETISRCWNGEPSERYSMKECLSDIIRLMENTSIAALPQTVLPIHPQEFAIPKQPKPTRQLAKPARKTKLPRRSEGHDVTAKYASLLQTLEIIISAQPEVSESSKVRNSFFEIPDHPSPALSVDGLPPRSQATPSFPIKERHLDTTTVREKSYIDSAPDLLVHHPRPPTLRTLHASSSSPPSANISHDAPNVVTLSPSEATVPARPDALDQMEEVGNLVQPSSPLAYTTSTLLVSPSSPSPSEIAASNCPESPVMFRKHGVCLTEASPDNKPRDESALSVVHETRNLEDGEFLTVSPVFTRDAVDELPLGSQSTSDHTIHLPFPADRLPTMSASTSSEFSPVTPSVTIDDTIINICLTENDENVKDTPLQDRLQIDLANDWTEGETPPLKPAGSSEPESNKNLILHRAGSIRSPSALPCTEEIDGWSTPRPGDGFGAIIAQTAPIYKSTSSTPALDDTRHHRYSVKEGTQDRPPERLIPIPIPASIQISINGHPQPDSSNNQSPAILQRLDSSSPIVTAVSGASEATPKDLCLTPTTDDLLDIGFTDDDSPSTNSTGEREESSGQHSVATNMVSKPSSGQFSTDSEHAMAGIDATRKNSPVPTSSLPQIQSALHQSLLTPTHVSETSPHSHRKGQLHNNKNDEVEDEAVPLETTEQSTGPYDAVGQVDNEGNAGLVTAEPSVVNSYGNEGEVALAEPRQASNRVTTASFHSCRTMKSNDGRESPPNGDEAAMPGILSSVVNQHIQVSEEDAGEEAEYRTDLGALAQGHNVPLSYTDVGDDTRAGPKVPSVAALSQGDEGDIVSVEPRPASMASVNSCRTSQSNDGIGDCPPDGDETALLESPDPTAVSHVHVSEGNAGEEGKHLVDEEAHSKTTTVPPDFMLPTVSLKPANIEDDTGVTGADFRDAGETQSSVGDAALMAPRSEAPKGLGGGPAPPSILLVEASQDIVPLSHRRVPVRQGTGTSSFTQRNSRTTQNTFSHLESVYSATDVDLAEDNTQNEPLSTPNANPSIHSLELQPIPSLLVHVSKAPATDFAKEIARDVSPTDLTPGGKVAEAVGDPGSPVRLGSPKERDGNGEVLDPARKPASVWRTIKKVLRKILCCA